MGFEIIKTDSRTKARLGKLTTLHGVVQTPVFMDVGTLGTVKSLEPRDLKEAKTQVVLGNTYHLMLPPGPEIISAAGGLHRFMGWDGPILTDSGGFQVFSLAKMRRLTEEGCRFNSHIDGHEFFLGPKESMAMQRIIGSDIAMVFDECLPYPCDRARAEKSVEQTLRWAQRSKDEPHAEGQQVFGIVQGGVYDDLRRHCAEELVRIGFDGYAVGGVSVGEPEIEMYRAVDASVPFLPEDKPRYVMGLGVMHQMAECVARGVDMFDCVIPTRIARHGTAITRQGNIAIKAAKYAFDQGPVEEGCPCPCCQSFSRSYIRHLLACGEITGMRLLTIHNVWALNRFMEDKREAILNDCFIEWKDEFFKGRKA
jgi:queuine tRNA-ribosyltransferase